MTEFDALYYDGVTSARQPVRVRSADGILHIEGAALNTQVALAAASLDPPIGGAPHILHLPGGAQLRTEDTAALDALFARSNRMEGWVHGMEQRWPYALAAIAIIAVFAWWCVIYGVPVAAHLAATMVPVPLEAKLGEQAFASLDGSACAPSALDTRWQQELRGAFAALVAGLDDGYAYRLELRACPRIGPNAFALPGGIVVLTDDLVRLARNDARVTAVLAHEIGHVRHRHGLRLVLQASGVAALIATLMGDAVSITQLAIALPTVLLQSSYSRDFENEADVYAIQRLKALGVSPKNFADMLILMEDYHEKNAGGGKGAAGASGAQDYLSTHPLTAKRIERAVAAAGH